jgi:hypothetical protein
MILKHIRKRGYEEAKWIQVGRGRAKFPTLALPVLNLEVLLSEIQLQITLILLSVLITCVMQLSSELPQTAATVHLLK